MFTIGIDGPQYASLWLAMIAGKQISLDMRRSVRIYRNGEIVKFLRY